MSRYRDPQLQVGENDSYLWLTTEQSAVILWRSTLHILQGTTDDDDGSGGHNTELSNKSSASESEIYLQNTRTTSVQFCQNRQN